MIGLESIIGHLKYYLEYFLLWLYNYTHPWSLIVGSWFLIFFIFRFLLVRKIEGWVPDVAKLLRGWISLLTPLLLIFSLLILIIGLVLLPFLAIGLVLIRRKVKELAKDLNTGLKQALFVWIILSNYPFNLLIKILRSLKRIEVKGKFPWEKKGVLVVTNHPSWVDQGTIIQFIISYLNWLKNPDCFPFIGAARDSIIRVPILRIFKAFYFLIPVERYKLSEAAPLVEKMEEILKSGGNLIISGPAGRDFKKKEGETIYSPNGKPLRKFGGLCGRLAILPRVTTLPGYIEGTDNLFLEVNGEMKFSLQRLFLDFLLLGKFQIKIIFGEPLMLEGWPKEKAREEIEKAVLNLADIC